MLSILGDLLSVIENFPAAILDGVETVINALFSAIATLITALFAACPGMPTLPTLPTGEWLSWANWVYPFGTMFAILTGCITMYVAYLVIRYVLNLLRADM